MKAQYFLFIFLIFFSCDSEKKERAQQFDKERAAQKIDYEKLTKVARTVHATAVAVGNAAARPKVDGKARD